MSNDDSLSYSAISVDGSRRKIRTNGRNWIIHLKNDDEKELYNILDELSRTTRYLPRTLYYLKNQRLVAIAYDKYINKDGVTELEDLLERKIEPVEYITDYKNGSKYFDTKNMELFLEQFNTRSLNANQKGSADRQERDGENSAEDEIQLAAPKTTKKPSRNIIEQEKPGVRARPSSDPNDNNSDEIGKIWKKIGDTDQKLDLIIAMSSKKNS